MYDDDYDRRDSRRLSYMASPLSETLSMPSLSDGTSETRDGAGESSTEGSDRTPRGSLRPERTRSSPYDRERPAALHRTASDTATSSFPLNDIDYESDPAAVAQELSNLAAIRRMSMDVTGDPDLPSFNSNFQVPSIAPSASADENDASRLFWVPARLHPELAPMEFKSFLESKADQINRRSGDFSSANLGLDRQGSGGGLRRKRSMLSRQIDNSNEYTDGAERLERKRSESQGGKQDTLNPNLHDLETLVDDTKQLNREALALLGGVENLDISANEDKPILPPAPPGHSLKRSTRTQYRKGSLKKGERLPYSKRIGRTPETIGEESPSAAPSGEEQPAFKGLTRASTDPGLRGSDKTSRQYQTQTPSPPARSTALPPGSTPNSTFESILDQKASSSAADTSSQTRQWYSRISSNGRSTLQIPASAQTVPHIVETPPAPHVENRASTTPSSLQSNPTQERTLSGDAQSKAASSSTSSNDPINARPKRPPLSRQPASHSPQTLTDLASHPAPLPGNTTRTDSLSMIPTLTEDKKSESKKSKDKKDSEGGRKSSWHWLLGTEEKEKEKKKEKDKDKDGEGKKGKLKQSASLEKMHDKHDKHDNARLDVLQSSIDSVSRGRESLVLERPVDPKLDEERRKESARKASGESKKDKESGLLSSIFGGGKKKSGSGDGHKKHSSRNFSPDPPARELIPDVDYGWTRFPILEERAIYRLAHIKLANPRRSLYSQVLLSNFMYSYLAKVQQMHPQMAIPTSAAQRTQQKKDQPEEYTQYQRYQEVRLCSCVSDFLLTLSGTAIWRQLL
jgi:hypothetical protein